MNCNKRKYKVRQNNLLDMRSRIVIKKKKKKQLDKKSRVDIKKKKFEYKIQNICIYKKTKVYGGLNCKSTVFYRTPAPIIVYYFPYITCLLYLLFLIKHVRTSG